MAIIKKILFKLRPAQILALGFGSIILIGTLLLTLPASVTTHAPLTFLQALFTATSAVCVTGLSIIEIGLVLSPFGQMVLLILIQLGGIGVMTAASMIYMVMGRKISLRSRLLIRDSLSEDNLQGVVRMTRNVMIVTITCETVGALLLAIRFIPMLGVGKGIYFSVFHSISAFCNAGFDVFGNGNSLVNYANDPIICITVMLLIIFGGLGFFVVVELYKKTKLGKKYHLSLNAKIVIIVTSILIFAGFGLFLAIEAQNPKTLGNPNMPWGEKILNAFFQSVTPRTAGFATIPQQDLLPASKTLTTIYMFIGASPVGTGGGVKTTTLAILILFVLSIVRGKQDVELMKRRINHHTILRAIAFFTLAVAFVCTIITVMVIIEHGIIPTGDIVFETVSAFGTVGLSTGVTATLADASKVLLIITMFAGRVGLLTLSFALANRISTASSKIRYPEGKIIIG